ncbi:MAG: hypothetical protein ABEI99_05725, partial [Halobaculum sp.]
DQFRRLPVLLDDDTFHSAVSRLQREGDIVVEGDRSNYYVAERDEYPPEVRDGMTLHHPDDLPDVIFEVEDQSDDSSGTETGVGEVTGVSDDGGTTVETGGRTVETDEESSDGTTTVQRVSKTLRGNGPRVLRSQAESRINRERDRIDGVDISLDGEGMSKEQLLTVLESLPEADRIDVEVEVEREDA